MERQKLLVVEDDETVRGQMSWALSDEYLVLPAGDAQGALEMLKSEGPGLVTLDLGLPPDPHDTGEGFKLLMRILEHDPITKVIVVTGNTRRAEALSAISLGAHDFFTKPIEMDELKAILRRACYVYALEAEYRNLRKQCEYQPLEEVIGTSPRMQEVFSTVRKAAPTDVPVLITGESGTGKELIARAIHANSTRRDNPFIPINCGAIPDNLLESELFGHEKGAFTGAHIQRMGRIELARGGTLFLDEIAELSPTLQVKMLRFLQNHKIERVGGREQIEIDARVVAATNRFLKRMIADEAFREDLYYRLAVVTIDLPPLRERGDDALLLVRTFLHRFSGDSAPRFLSLEAIEAIKSYEWPGNVRELENRIKRAVAFSEGPVIKPSDMGFGLNEMDMKLDLRKAKEDLEAKFANLAILKHKGNVSRAASELGLSRPTLHHIIKKHKIRK